MKRTIYLGTFLTLVLLVTSTASAQEAIYYDEYGNAYYESTGEPVYVDPIYVEPVYDATYVEPDYIEPDYIEPDYYDPDYVEPDYVEPEHEPVVHEETSTDHEIAEEHDTATDQEEFRKLPVWVQNFIKDKIASGELPSKEDLEKLPPELKDEIIQIISQRLKEKENAEKDGDTAGKKGGFDSFISEYWVQFLALVVSLVGVGLAVTGFTFANAKKKKSVTKLINQIDDTFASFKWKSKRCEAELYRLQDVIEDELKEGKLDEGAYHLLVNRIDKYLKEIKEIDGNPRGGRADELHKKLDEVMDEEG